MQHDERADGDRRQEHRREGEAENPPGGVDRREADRRQRERRKSKS